MFKLSNLIFLDEGLLKIPPVLSAKVKELVFGLFAAKAYVLSKEELKILQNSLIKTEEQSTQFKENISEIVKIVRGLLKQTIKSNRTQVFKLPFINFPSYSYGSSRISEYMTIETEIDSNNFGFALIQNIDNERVEAKAFHGNKDYLDELMEEFAQWFEDDFYTYTIISKRDTIDSKIETINDHLPELEAKADREFLTGTKDIKNSFGKQFYISLTPDMFNGWNPGYSQMDISKLLFKRNNKLENPEINLYVKFERTPKEKFISGGENYSGLYKRMQKYGSDRRHVYEIEIVIPYFRPGSYYNDMIKEVNRTVDHELGHFVQEIIQQIVTGQSQIDYYLSGGKGIVHGTNSKKLSNKIEREERPRHELRDVEFYTRLGDAKSEIEDRIGFFKNHSEKMNAFKDIVGIERQKKYNDYVLPTNRWLSILKKENPKKWYKAVKELYKELFGLDDNA